MYHIGFIHLKKNMPAVWTSVMTLWRSSSSRLSIIIWTKFFFNTLCKHCTFRELIYRPSGSDCLRSMLTIFRAIIVFIVLWRFEMDVDMACKLGSYQRDALTLTLFCDAWFLRCSKVMHACCASKWSHHMSVLVAAKCDTSSMFRRQLHIWI